MTVIIRKSLEVWAAATRQTNHEVPRWDLADGVVDATANTPGKKFDRSVIGE